MPKPKSKTQDIPIAIWPCAQRPSQWQRYRRYRPESNSHPAKMLPELARRAIETYSEPGDLVLDPMCGIGTTLVEAIHADRRAIGIDLEPRWVRLAEENVAHAVRDGARGRAEVVDGDARDLARLLVRPSRKNIVELPYGRADLIVMSPPYGCEIGRPRKDAWETGRCLCPGTERNYSPSRENLGHARGDSYATAMADVYASCLSALKPGGFLVVVTKDMRSKGALRNLAGETVALCEGVGLVYWQHVIALLASLRDDQIVARPYFWQTVQVRKARARGERTHLVCHEDVLVFRRPASSKQRSRAAQSARRAA